MPEGTITEVKGKGEPFTTNYGDLVPWTVVVEGHGELEVNRKPSSPPPAVGALVEKIEDTEHGKPATPAPVNEVELHRQRAAGDGVLARGVEMELDERVLDDAERDAIRKDVGQIDWRYRGRRPQSARVH